MKTLLLIGGMLAGSILTRMYDRSPRARRIVHWCWTLDQRWT